MTSYNRFLIATLSGVACFGAMSSIALAAPVERYSIVKTDNGFVRTDIKTGYTSICTLTDDQLICRASIDEIRAFEDTNHQLQERITTLEKKISDIEASSRNFLDLNNSKEVDEALDMMEGFMERFFDMAKNLKHDDKS